MSVDHVKRIFIRSDYLSSLYSVQYAAIGIKIAQANVYTSKVGVLRLISLKSDEAKIAVLGD